MRILLIGGVRSGKSALAEEAAARLSRAQGLPVTYVATARRSDGEMEERIRRHRARRPATWTTVEAGGPDPEELASAVKGLRQPAILLLDCLSLWVATAVEAGGGEERYLERLSRLVAAVSAVPHAVVVSVEAGMGLVPTERVGREFLDRLGDANQAFAKAADRVVLALAGLPLPLKGGGLF